MKRTKKARLSDIIPDAKYRKEIEQGLLEGKELIGPKGVFSTLFQAVVDAALEGEMDHHLLDKDSSDTPNRRNGHTSKKVKSKVGEVTISPPRDRNGSFQPTIVEKRKKELNGGLETIILALYGKGNSVEDIHRLLFEIYGIEYSTSAISLITDRIWPKIQEWQQRSLNSCYAILYLDGMHFRVKTDGQFRDKTVYSVYAVDVEGKRDVLGIYLDDTESSTQWRMVLEDLKKRGLTDIFFVCIDGLKGFKTAIQDVFPKSIVQRCIVHKIRNSVRFVSDKEKKRMCAGLRCIYTAANREQASLALDNFEKEWGKQGERIAKLWRKDWDELMAFMDFSQHIRRMIYTTNPVEALHRIIRKTTKSKGAWISERALIKQLYLSLEGSEKSWRRKAYHWKAIQAEMQDKFGERFDQWLEK